MNNAQMERAGREYMESRALSAQPIEIVHMLYQVAIDNLNAAISCLDSGDAFARARAVTKAEEAVQELMVSLDHSVAPFTRTLADLYHYVLRSIVKGHAKKSRQAFEEALSVLTTLAVAWVQVKNEVLANAQSANGSDDSEMPAPTASENPYGAYATTASGSRDWTC
jgi:flagellar protein FliS